MINNALLANPLHVLAEVEGDQYGAEWEDADYKADRGERELLLEGDRGQEGARDQVRHERQKDQREERPD